MAQAARLNLRMQKELKLLITDPPPGASFPSLSNDSSASSLTSIDAHFQGPKGTVYANGVFKIKIQIPERYPFQPPIVTFSTPIYHPNIDNGGRICLDILNLPPKGSWQPSLNISTVLTSIGLLLSEPNPDDGLMHDASREYKYNRQAFDQKARSMSDKYAKAGESDSSIGNQNSQTPIHPSTSKTDSKGSDASVYVTENFVSQKILSGSSRKLSLGSSSKQASNKEMCKLPNHNYSKNHTDSAQPAEAKANATEFNRNLDKQQATKHKLSLKVPFVSHSGNSENTWTNMPNHCPSMLANLNPSMDSPESLPLVKVDFNHAQVPYQDNDFTGKGSKSVNQQKRLLESVKTSHKIRHSGDKLQPVSTSNEALSWPISTSHATTNPHKDSTDRSRSGSTDIKLQKLGTVVLRTSLGSTGHSSLLDHEKENLAPDQSSRLKLSHLTNSKGAPVSEKGMCHTERTGKLTLNVAKKLSGKEAKLPLEPLNQCIGINSKLKLHLENSSSPRSKFLNVRNDSGSDEKQQICQVNCGDSTGEFKQNSVGSPIHEATIVLDSEDSEDEIVPVRSKLSLTQRRLSLKRKLNV